MPFPRLRWSLLLALVCLLVPGLAPGSDATRKRVKPPPRKLVTLPGGESLRHDAAAAFLRMSVSARAEGIGLWVSSGYRTRWQQRLLYERYRLGLGPRAARPGQSNHQRGLAVDVAVGDEDTPTYRWLAANACLHGFRRTVPSEPWHWEYRPRTTRPPPVDTDCLGQPLPPKEPARANSSS
ncbi:D-alanyl-D-alanine carboxypeptidase family protein [Vitiosangium sp. GDMCC 1.1324]|uniref:M15 family metallopeptidase n=1 Tax=Vitiosangium sp. (strain GDMCC 1.1324) TaxID=2138576 RepID=UPI000D3B3B9F|nr:M15 family metallopeptidase [Vitiosangium sp. GDMCC 1.1324]PTL81619.1 D-alanyl-D-alanine carboxypeptidase [Vitiosangium sp. GDMCC 1.1324]